MRVALIGAGHIARALAEGWRRAPAPPALVAYDVVPEAAAALAAATGAEVAASAAAAAEAADVVVVAVRPPQVASALAALRDALGARPLVSLAAGVPVARLTAALPHGARVGRAMPSVSARLRLGATLVVAGTLGEALAGVRDLFRLVGAVFDLDEGSLDAATAVSGCLPGVVARLAAGLTAAAVAEGVPADVAGPLVRSALHGAAAVVDDEGDPERVLTAAATPGGMTAAAVEALAAAGIDAALRAAVRAAAARAAALAPDGAGDTD